MTRALLPFALVACSSPDEKPPATRAPPPPPAGGAELIGEPMPEWTATEWLDPPPLTIAGLRGKVVLVRNAGPRCRGANRISVVATPVERGVLIIRPS